MEKQNQSFRGIMKSKTKKRSPLKDKPLRYAGQSIDDQIDDLRTDAIFYVMFPTFLATYILLRWMEQTFPPSKSSFSLPPYIGTLFFFGLIGYCIFKLLQIVNKMRILVMARDGEKIVAEGLLDLIKQGAAILNDIQGDKFNIDHVVISPHGIYLIETKTYSKPTKKESTISFDSENVFVDGRVVDRQPIRQAKALSKWLQELLQKSTGEKIFVQPVILFPGWFVEPMKKGQEVWILNPKALPTFIANEPVRLKETDVHLITFHLSRYIRTYDAK
jgi:Nuclease-related domain